MVDLKQDIQYIKGVGPNRAKLLANLGIYTLEDLDALYFYDKIKDNKKSRRRRSFN